MENREVNLGGFTHFCIFIITLCCISMCIDTYYTQQNTQVIKEHIDSVAVDSVVVYKMK